jgi:hypothetical protein
MLCLSKNLSDKYINMFAAGAGLEIQNYGTDIGSSDILIRGMTKSKIIKECWESGRTFFYMDGGYFGNYKSATNPFGNKLYHRIVKNNLQHTVIQDVPSDRWDQFNYVLPNRKFGKHVLLVTPSEKPCKFYGINLQDWINTTINEIQQYTDRPIVIRNKSSRKDRLVHSIYEDLAGAHAVVTYNSIAAVESVLAGIPVFTLAPTAADPVCNKNLKLLENPSVFDKDTIYKWARHLAYGQFHIDEFRDGSAYKLLYEYS